MKNTESFSSIPAAIVTINSGETSAPFSGNDTLALFAGMTEQLSEGDNPLISPHYVDMAEAEQMLTDGEIDGIFYWDGGINLMVMKQGLNQSVLKSVSESFMRISQTIGTISQARPDMFEQAYDILTMEIEQSANKEITLGRGETDIMISYFYSLIAMSCLYGSMFGYAKAIGIQANMSPLAARRSVSPSRKISMIIGDTAAAVTVQFIEALIVIAYLAFVLGVNFGDQWGFVILTSLAASIMGVTLCLAISTVLKSANENAIGGILSGIVLLLCFLSGLMVSNMKYIIEKNVPFINKINPAALISDAFYSLTVYDNYSRYTQCMLSMLAASALFCIISALVLRRRNYASI
jgi:ABC-2 type transport system permease protein